MRRLTWRVGALLFGSGCCALVYQIGWLREFRLIFGASTEASAAVLAIFIGGLGLGGLVLGPRADRHPRPILFYSQLEGIVAASAALSPFLLTLVRAAYVAVGGTARLGLVAGTILRLILSALVLAVPTIVMGGTLPAAARGVTRRADARRQDVAALYGLNTLGAVVGATVATFFFLELFGTRATLWLAAAANAIIAIVARQVDRTASAASPEYGAAPASSHEAAPSPDQGTPPAWFILLASGVVGFAFFVMELVWYRMLGPLLGGSVFTFGLILAVALVGIGLGGLMYALVGSGRPASLAGFATSCLLEAAAVAAAYAFGDRLAVVAVALLPLGHAGFAARVAGWAIVTAIVAFPAAIVAGYQFPMLISLFGSGRERLGRQVGLAYATNTIGAIVGSLAGGFGLLPWLTAPGVWRFAAGSLVALGIAAGVLAFTRGARRLLMPALGLTAATIALLFSVGPTALWRHSGIGAGRSGIDTIVSANQLRSWRNGARRSIIWDGDGLESSVALAIQPSGYAFIVNGKSDGSARGDTSTMVMTGLLGALLGQNQRRALVIGLGTGASAGWLGAVPSLERVDVIELEPLILDVAKACEAVNHDVLDNPRVHIAIGDARERLLTSTERYDLIASEPSNPFRAGVASLFTREYYQAARDRLSADGVFLQWMQAYEIDARTLRTVYATFASVFPYIETWQLGPDDLALIGSAHPLGYSARSLAQRIQQEPYKSGLAVAWHAVDADGVLSHYLAGDRLARAIASARGVDLNTDDRNVVEFGFARSLGSKSVLTNDVREIARAMGDGRPPIDDGAAVNWDAVDTARVSFLASENYVMLAGAQDDGPPAEVARRRALLKYYGTGDSDAARKAWAEQTDPPRDPVDTTMVADLVAQLGDDRALPLIDRVRVYEPGEADAILADLRQRQGHIDEAVSAVEAAFNDFRATPWTGFRYKLKALSVANTIGKQYPAAAARLFVALQRPWSVRAMETDRLTTAATLLRQLDFRSLCRPVFAAAEPFVPWDVRFLTERKDCYAATGDDRLEVATRELTEYLQGEPLPLATGLSLQQSASAR